MARRSASLARRRVAMPWGSSPFRHAKRRRAMSSVSRCSRKPPATPSRRRRSTPNEQAAMTLIVCPLRFVETLVSTRRPSHLITLLAPEEMIGTPSGVAIDHHLRLGVHDIAEPIEGLTHPNDALIERLLDFGRQWDESAPLLI